MKINFLILFVLSLFVSNIALGCSASLTLSNMPLYFFTHPLGIYTIDLSPTMNIIDGDDHSGYPYYEKIWSGSCPGGLSGHDNTCIEFTVYPDATNFSPGNIMQKIKQYTHGKANRGEVRIITDSTESNYVYTTDHEQNFCGPYTVPTSKID